MKRETDNRGGGTVNFTERRALLCSSAKERPMYSSTCYKRHHPSAIRLNSRSTRNVFRPRSELAIRRW